MDKKLRIVFMGTPSFAVTALKKLHESDHEVVCVYTQPAKPAGRRAKIAINSLVHRYAERNGIEVRTPKTLKDADAQQDFADLNADIAVVAAYGLILPKEILEAPKYGCLNIHASLLPRWRGAAPIQRAIMAGDTETGVCIMQMDEGLDTGDVLLRRETPITPETTSSDLHDVLATMGADMTLDIIDQIASGYVPVANPQSDDGMTYAKMLSRDDGKIDWSLSAQDIERYSRALNPWPGLWCMADGKRLKVLKVDIAEGQGEPGQILSKEMIVACGDGAVKLISVQPENKKEMAGMAFFNGVKIGVGDRLE